MDTRLSYPTIIKQVLHEYVTHYSEGNEDTLRVVFDDERQSYLLLDVGWYEDEYIHHTPIHIDIIDDKIWIQYDDTEDGIATELLQADIPHTNIVLGFRHPQIRPHTEFAPG
jgi:hypothetical protein